MRSEKKDIVEEFLDEIYYKECDGKWWNIGKVLDSVEIEIGVPVYEYESDADYDSEEWEDDMDASVVY